jgi:hypothetical protein
MDMGFLNRLLNLAGGKLSELTSNDDALSDAALASELDGTRTRPGPAAQAELTLRRAAPSEPADEDEPVEKTL